MICFSRCIALLVICRAAFLTGAQAQTVTVIPADQAAAHINEYATVEGVVANVFTSKSGNTFLNIGAAYPNQTFTGWIPPASPVSKSPLLSGIEGKQVKITGRIEMYKGKPEIRINAAAQLQLE
jgi:DNA/RNA endonuclease YhcR with UshA esterase domain